MSSLDKWIAESSREPDIDEKILSIWHTAVASEIAYWRRWIATKGGKFPEDFAVRTNPKAELQLHIARYLPTGQDVASILDVGAGPLTCLRRTTPGITLEVTAVDALADEYNKILEEYGIVPLIKTQQCFTERLSHKFGYDRFDIAYARNTLDHSMNPLLGIGEMLSVVHRGGIVLTEHARNEGETHKYTGLHQWNFDVREHKFVLSGRDSSPMDLAGLLDGQARMVELTATGPFTRFALEKLCEGAVTVKFA